MERELESIIMAGSMVHFVYLDPDGNKEKDFEFDARCHFIPRIGDKIETGRDRPSFVKAVYHRFTQSDKFEKGVFFQVVNVLLTNDPGLKESAPVQ